MRRYWRWAVALGVVAALAVLPSLAHLLPAGTSTIGASRLFSRITASQTVPYSGLVQSRGGVTLPSGADAFSAADDLFGESKDLRVWWRGGTDWRIDSIGLTGETDTYRDADGLWTWDYESGVARRTSLAAVPLVRLPRTDDIVPPSLARRLLSEVDPSAVQRLPGRRIAGEQTAGLRLTVSDPRSTVERIDVWALPATGLPLEIDVYGTGSTPVISSRFLDVTLDRPDSATTAFRSAPGAQRRSGEYGDIVSAIDQLGQSAPPQRVAGLARRQDLDLGSVGVYGRGVTVLVTVPLSPRLAGEVVPQLRRTPGMVEDSSGISAGAGPLSLQLSPPTGFGARWLLVGTLTKRALLSAVADLPPARGFGIGR